MERQRNLWATMFAVLLAIFDPFCLFHQKYQKLIFFFRFEMSFEEPEPQIVNKPQEDKETGV